MNMKNAFFGRYVITVSNIVTNFWPIRPLTSEFKSIQAIHISERLGRTIGALVGVPEVESRYDNTNFESGFLDVQILILST